MIFSRLVKSACGLAFGVMLTACSHDYLLMKTEEQLHGYEAAIRWSLFKRAAGYLADPAKAAPDWKRLEQIRVTGYVTTFRDLFQSGKVLTQTVKIRYLTGNGVVERTIEDEQRWRFDELQERWLLETGLPKFK